MSPTVRVSTGARAHFGFGNLSLSRGRLYGGIGVALAEPTATVVAEPADRVRAPDPVAEYATRTVERLSVDGVTVRLEESLPGHVGLGSGTQQALATATAVAAAHDRRVDPRELAPALGRGGRSGVGVAAFEEGGFVVDAGHPTERFTTDPPPDGEWSVPPVVARHDLPDRWRFLLVRPDVDPGRSGKNEERSMRSVVEDADPAVADRIAGVVVRRLLPAVPTDDPAAFGEAIAEIGRLNGTWYAEEQGGVFRPPVGTVVDHLGPSPGVLGATQSSWGPTVVGVTTTDRSDAARSAGREALAEADVDGTVAVVAPDNDGATLAVDGSTPT